jgi:hypothetical protein|tara:strand:+ start:326 stop:505 length:180 start_codon:yes stop_codon:yes gene_type:complete
MTIDKQMLGKFRFTDEQIYYEYRERDALDMAASAAKRGRHCLAFECMQLAEKYNKRANK